MENTVGIKIDYLKERENPEQIFIAMAHYISAYKEFGELLAEATGYNFKYELILKGIETGSIKAVLGSITNGFSSFLEKQSSEFLNDLIFTNEIISPEQVNDLAELQERRIEKENISISPYINRVSLAKILQELSAANEMLNPQEKAEIENIKAEGSNVININTNMRFLGDPETMFDEHNPMKYRGKDCLDIIKPVNFGDAQWQVRSRTTHKTFMATIGHKDWLKKYQSGDLPIITAKHCMLVEIYYELDNKHKKLPIKKAIITKVLKLIPSSEVQDALL